MTGLAVLALSQSVSKIYAQPLSRSAELARRFAACYELSVPSWSVSQTKQDKILPLRFQLTMVPDSASRDFIAKNQDPKTYYMVGHDWKVTPDGTLELIWGTGYVGYTIRFTSLAAATLSARTDTELHGTAHYFTDAPILPGEPDFSVVARRVACPQPK
jgi:hypothetical protein